MRLRVSFDLVVHGRVCGSEERRKGKKRQNANPHGGVCSSKLCCLSSVLLLLSACVLAVFFCCCRVVVSRGVMTTDFKCRGLRCHGHQRLSGKACWLASFSPIAEALRIGRSSASQRHGVDHLLQLAA